MSGAPKPPAPPRSYGANGIIEKPAHWQGLFSPREPPKPRSVRRGRKAQASAASASSGQCASPSTERCGGSKNGCHSLRHWARRHRLWVIRHRVGHYAQLRRDCGCQQYKPCCRRTRHCRSLVRDRDGAGRCYSGSCRLQPFHRPARALGGQDQCLHRTRWRVTEPIPE